MKTVNQTITTPLGDPDSAQQYNRHPRGRDNLSNWRRPDEVQRQRKNKNSPTFAHTPRDYFEYAHDVVESLRRTEIPPQSDIQKMSPTAQEFITINWRALSTPELTRYAHGIQMLITLWKDRYPHWADHLRGLLKNILVQQPAPHILLSGQLFFLDDTKMSATAVDDYAQTLTALDPSEIPDSYRFWEPLSKAYRAAVDGAENDYRHYRDQAADILDNNWDVEWVDVPSPAPTGPHIITCPTCGNHPTDPHRDRWEWPPL